jgi:hypothetical protein
MRSRHLIALALLCLASAVQATPRLLSESELSQVQAAGLEMLPIAHEFQEQSVALERQQAVAQLRLAGSTAQLGGGVMQTLALAGLATPFAALLLPTLAMPLPLFMPLPPKHTEQH